MRYGVLILPDDRWSVNRERWQLAERLGFDHAWVYDHLTWRGLRDKPWFSSIPILTAAAAATTRIRLGTLVASPNFRHPVPFAKELMTLDDISGGRLTLGFGAGADGFDATATRAEAWAPADRQARYEEFVASLDLLLSAPESSFQGRYYLANEARAIPGCVQKPRIPFALAATGRRGMQVVARFAHTWVAVDSRGPLAAQVALLEDACDVVPGACSELDRLVLLGHRVKPLSSSSAFGEMSERYAALGFTDLVVHWPRAEEPFKAELSTLERIAADHLHQS